MTFNPHQTRAFQQVRDELTRAELLHPTPFPTLEHALMVIREEYLECEAEVFKKPHARDMAALDRELTQLAAMALKAKMQLTLPDLEE